MINPFFQNKGPLKIEKILISIKAKRSFENLDTESFDIKDLITASKMKLHSFTQKNMNLWLQLQS
jgi:hypothetical protein